MPRPQRDAPTPLSRTNMPPHTEMVAPFMSQTTRRFHRLLTPTSPLRRRPLPLSPFSTGTGLGEGAHWGTPSQMVGLTAKTGGCSSIPSGESPGNSGRASSRPLAAVALCSARRLAGARLSSVSMTGKCEPRAGDKASAWVARARSTDELGQNTESVSLDTVFIHGPNRQRVTMGHTLR